MALKSALIRRAVLRRVRKQVALLVNRAALHRDVVPEAGERRLEAFAAVNDHEIRFGEPSAGQIIEHGPPGGLALAAHVPDREHHLLACGDAERDQQRDGGGLAIQADLDHRAIEDQTDDVVAGEITFLPATEAARVFCQARLTTSLPIWPSNSLASARRTRRVFMPAR